MPKCLEQMPFYDRIHAVIERTSRNQRNHGSNEKRSRSLLTDTGKDFGIKVYDKSSDETRNKDATPYRFSDQKNEPA